MSQLRYSDRARLAERGTLGPLTYEAPAAFRSALAGVIQELSERPPVGILAYMAATRHAAQHFERYYESAALSGWIRDPRSSSTEDVLDTIEIVIEEATLLYRTRDSPQGVIPWADITARISRLLLRYRFGFTLDAKGFIHRVGSPALDEAIVGPALLAIQRPGWEQVDRTFREALHHHRGGPDERDDALTAATSALESALKASGLDGTHLSQLAKSLRNSDLVPGQLKEVPELLDKLLKRSGAIRDEFSDAHGRDPNVVADVPAELVDLSIYWTGAFINYLAAATLAGKTSGGQ